MPIPFRNTVPDNHPSSIAWLQIIVDPAGDGVLAGLFEASPQGEPLGFGFVRMAYQDDDWNDALVSLSRALFEATTTTPALLIVSSEDEPPFFLGSLNLGIPCCFIMPPSGRSPEPRATGAQEWLQWVTDPPATPSLPGSLIDDIVDADEPFEPLERVTMALLEAYADSRIRTANDIQGVVALMSLTPRAIDKWREMSRQRGLSSSSVPGSPEADEPVRGLAERLWMVLARRVRSAPVALPEGGLKWSGELMPFQRQGVETLVTMDRLLLSDDMGLGKTVQTIAALRILKAKGDLRSALVVAPAGVLDQWRREIERWAPDISAMIIRGSADNRIWQWRARKDVLLVSYDVLRMDADVLRNLGPVRRTWDVVVLDEAQKIKNRNPTSAAAKDLPRARSWALTGTPIENNIDELASIMEFVDHDADDVDVRLCPDASLLKRHRELQLRRRKADVLVDLPPKLEIKLRIPLEPQQRKSYDQAEHDGVVYLRSLGREATIHHVLELITRLKQICNVDPRTGASSKLDDIHDRLGKLTAQGHKALIFSQYTGNTSGVAAAAHHLREFHPLCLTGAVPPAERMDLIEKFKESERHKALIISLRAGGVGLNLQEASYVFHLDRWWNPAVERQAEDRSHRMGQTVKVNVIKYTCEDTIEERIDTILQQKQALFDDLIDDVSLNLSTRLNRDELMGLFGLDQTG